MERKLLLTLCILFYLLSPLFAQQNNDKIIVSDNIELVRLSDKAYLHISYFQTENWGKVGANGILLVDSGRAVLIDSPWNDEQTAELYNWVKDTLGASITDFIASHWHEDCMGGLAFLHSKGVRSYACELTRNITQERGLPVPQQGFTDSIRVAALTIPVTCYYEGGGHTPDNIVVWMPTENILFGGCCVKDINSNSLGNLADADVPAWPGTMRKLLAKFPAAKTIVPGHGSPGGSELLRHTLQLLEK